MMRTTWVAILGLGVAACNQPAPAPTKAADTPAMAEEAAPVADAPAEPAAPSLAGTRWETGGYILEFKDGDRVAISGGMLATSFPEGVEGQYTLSDDGTVRIGHADGQLLVGQYNDGKMSLVEVAADQSPQ